jgi:hypothetical protein
MDGSIVRLEVNGIHLQAGLRQRFPLLPSQDHQPVAEKIGVQTLFLMMVLKLFSRHTTSTQWDRIILLKPLRSCLAQRS